jgi:simple sugar transport system ATP-binding protein/ribose transport system ATP-binding protein
MSNQPVLVVKNINKRFGGIQALKDISVTIKKGTVHALVGENGAGKSTLGKIIGGALHPDSGRVIINGKSVSYRSPREALADGISLISQEIALVPKRTVIENVYLGAENNRFGFVINKEIRNSFNQLIAQTGIMISPDVYVSELSIAEQKKVEILRAIARNASIIVMDEPTASLSANEVEKLLALIVKLKSAGKTIIYVSHFLEEVLSIADTVTVLRNGQCVKTSLVSNETKESLIEAMVGKYFSVKFPEKKYPDNNAPVILSVEGLTRPGVFKNISFKVRKGEILGFAGLVGSGRSEIVRAIFGADPWEKGTVKIKGDIVNPHNPIQAIKAGIALLPESRKLQGLVLKLPILHNVSLPHLKEVSFGPFIKSYTEKGRAVNILKELDVRPLAPFIETKLLSGGNQQKVLFAKWLFKKPDIFIADEPTAGIDVGAKHEIYKLIKRLADEGMAVILISSDLNEVIGLSHRVIAISRGKIVETFSGDEIREEKIMHAIFDVENNCAEN